MTGEWIQTTIGQQATLQRGFDITKAEQRDGEVPVVSSGGVSSYHNEAQVPGPGVVLGRKGVVGSVYYVKPDYWPHDTTLWVKDFHGNEPRFVYYFFRWMASRIASMDVGSANPTLNRNHVHPIEILWPSLPEQRAIAHILGTLDDKIQLNLRMNETLEEMARAIFKSWFVDFDPVRSKAESRDTGLPEHIADLLPDRFEDSEVGAIPAGWTIEPLDQVAHFLNGLALQKYPQEDSEYLPAIKIAELRKGVTASSGRASIKIPPQYIVEDGDVLFSWSGSLEVQLWTGGRGALNQHLFKVTSHRYPKWFYYYWIKHHLMEFRDIAADKATTMGHIKRRHLTNALTIVPPNPTLEMMSVTMEPLVNKMLNNDLESHTLASIRDMLLPRLISGKVRVGETAEQVEEVL